MPLFLVTLPHNLKLYKHKPTNVGRIALERQAGGKTFAHARIWTIDLTIPNQKHCPLGYQALIAMLQPIFLLATSFTSEWEQ